MRNRWATEDFEQLGWHDVHVHALRIVEGEHGTGDLLLDIDYILEWLRSGPGFRFRIAPATLGFHGISDLRIALDYEGARAGICAFSLAGIRREVATTANGPRTYRWTLDVNWPTGLLTFLGSGFTQELTGPVVETTSRQWLVPAERGA